MRARGAKKGAAGPRRGMADWAKAFVFRMMELGRGARIIAYK